MKESNLKGNASGFNKSVRANEYYGPEAQALVEDQEHGTGGIDNHRLFPEEPITVGQVKKILDNGNQEGKPCQILKAKPVNDNPTDGVGDTKPVRTPKVPKFLPTEEEKENIRLAKEKQDALDAQKRAAIEAGDVPSSMQRDGNRIVIVPIPEDDPAPPTQNVSDVPLAPVSPRKHLSFEPAVDPYKEPERNPADDFIPGEVPAGAPTPAHRPTPSAPTPAAPKIQTPDTDTTPVPHPMLPGRLGRNQPKAPAPVSQAQPVNQAPAVEEAAAPLQDLMPLDRTPSHPMTVPATTTSQTSKTPGGGTTNNLPVVAIPDDAGAPPPLLPAPARAPLPKPVDARRAKPVTDRPSASNKPAPAKTSSVSPAASAPKVAKATSTTITR